MRGKEEGGGADDGGRLKENLCGKFGGFEGS